MAVSLKPEEILKIGEFSVTNSLITGIIIAILMILFFAIYTNKLTIKPRTKLQLFIEDIVLSLNELAKSIMGEKLAKTFFPFIFTFFTFIILSNWFGLLPFVGSVGYTHHAKEAGKALPIFVFGNKAEDTNKVPAHEEDIDADQNLLDGFDKVDIEDEFLPVEAQESEAKEKSTSLFRLTRDEEIEKPFFRSPSADLNFTLAMAIISFLLIQYAGLRNLGFEYLGKFFDYRVSIPKGWKIILLPVIFLINVFWKTLELVLELGKIVSFTFRLFGNIFAGEVLLFVMTSLTFGIFTLPFMGLEIFVGFIQAIVFSFLTIVFIKVASESHHEHPEDLQHANVA